MPRTKTLPSERQFNWQDRKSSPFDGFSASARKLEREAADGFTTCAARAACPAAKSERRVASGLLTDAARSLRLSDLRFVIERFSVCDRASITNAFSISFEFLSSRRL